MKRGAMTMIAPLLFSMSIFAQNVDTQISGKLDVQGRYYLNEGMYKHQDYQEQFSFSIQPELYWEWNNSADSLIFKPFYRYDQQDDERSHADIRELLWTHVGDDWEIKTGIGKVFWGVTEFQHLVDTINQTDGVESFDGEEKLGQPMVNLSLIRGWGVIDAFILPGFRERTFSGQMGRLRPPFHVEGDFAKYESTRKDNHIDYALRWSHSLDVFDFGLHWFNGTNRDPDLHLEKGREDGYFIPFYEQINQFGVDAQATIDEWLLKFEALSRNGLNGTYTAAQAGFEYSFYGVANSDADIGLLLEYGWDDRGLDSNSGFQNDLFFGARFTFNDVQSTELLIGGGYDLDYESNSLFVEGSHRVGNNWKIVVDAQFFNSKDMGDPSYSIKEDDYIQLTLEYYL